MLCRSPYVRAPNFRGDGARDGLRLSLWPPRTAAGNVRKGGKGREGEKEIGGGDKRDKETGQQERRGWEKEEKGRERGERERGRKKEREGRKERKGEGKRKGGRGRGRREKRRTSLVNKPMLYSSREA